MRKKKLIALLQKYGIKQYLHEQIDKDSQTGRRQSATFSRLLSLCKTLTLRCNI